MAETQYFLLPGPTQLPPRVVRAGSAPMVSHRGPEFVEIFTQMTNDMKDIYRTENDLLTLTCSGTGGLEAAAVNFINPGDKILVASIGNFGSRFRDICARYGADIDY
ncbi:MAG: aminotransferase class V-fold PLP-dependent enzyme, partial [Clostridiales bacterium]